MNLEAIKPSDLPTPPQAALQIMRACSQPEVNQKELTKLAQSDPVLTAELLRVVNSPFFGLSREIQSISRAVNILGQQTLRNVALCLAVKDALNAQAIRDFNSAEFWEDALRRATAAKLLARAIDADADECFTAGLLADFGLLVILFLQPEKGGLWASMRALNPAERHDAEREAFNMNHEQVGEKLAKAWELPTVLTEAIGNHHKPDNIEDARAQQLARILNCADWMAAVYSGKDKTAALNAARQVVKDRYDLNAEKCDEILSFMPQQVEEAGEALGFGIQQQDDFEQILRDANVRLAEANISYQELTWKLEKTLRERNRLAAELDRELTLAREIQQSLLPADTNDLPVTGLNHSARSLSGDFYEFFRLDDGRIYFSLGDVSGKGVNAALLMAKTASLFRCLGKRLHNPAELLSEINNELCETATRGMFVTMVAGIYDEPDQQLQIVNAGHLPPLVIDNEGKYAKLEAKALPLGIVPESDYTVREVNLKNRSLYVFSDGVTEGFLPDGTMLGMDGLLDLINKMHHLPARERLHAIVKQFTSAEKQLHDDVTLLLVEGRGSNG